MADRTLVESAPASSSLDDSAAGGELDEGASVAVADLTGAEGLDGAGFVKEDVAVLEKLAHDQLLLLLLLLEPHEERNT